MSTPTTIDIPFPEAETLHLRIAVGACRLNIRPGAGERWVTGTYEDPSNAVPLRIVQEGGAVTISQELNWPQNLGGFKQPPTFDLTLGAGQSYSLTLEGGASETAIDLGRCPLPGLRSSMELASRISIFRLPTPRICLKLVWRWGQPT